MQLHHPLLGRSLPTLEGLLESADHAVEAALLAASTLSHHRLKAHAEAQRCLENLTARPWSASVPTLPTPEQGIAATDLARALMATASDELKTVFFGEADTTLAFDEVAAQWRRAVQVEGPPQPLERFLARRLAMVAINRPPPWTVHALIEALGLDCWDSFSDHNPMYQDGLCTIGEAFAQLTENAWSHGVRAASVPAAYIDTHGVLSTLDAMLSTAPAAFLTLPADGEVFTDRGAYRTARAWTWRCAVGDGPEAMNGSRPSFEQHNYSWGATTTPPRDHIVPPTRAQGSIFIVHELLKAPPEPDWFLPRLEHLHHLLTASANPASGCRLLMLATDERRRQLIALSSRLGDLPVLPHTPVPTDTFLRRLCEIPMRQRSDEGVSGVMALVNGMTADSEGAGWSGVFTHQRDWEPERAPGSRPPYRVRNRLRLLNAEIAAKPWLEALLPKPYEALFALEDALTSL